ncbi:PTS fructose transporter subunit IIA [Halarchaeum grantii]|uniref:PTS fructose transporter subunit IIA n=1 Tax=Halarchaeum grantii TaxID=1193105 RepID=A0A830FB81_9EURY|nr:fructose PTS transporter subunit IIA [Halarchaeum grantii]GGL37448.1 PTS fructose transporter subunit IIA [Halarchaeum grantii]
MNESDLEELINVRLISLEEPPAEKEAVIEHLLDLAVEAGRVSDREQALADLLEREEESTTGVGMGIGIPHAKTTGVEEPTLAFARSSAGVDFGAMDDEPATLFFMILVPEASSDDHLQILSSLSRSLVHEETREKLHDADSAEAVQRIVIEEVA